MLNPPPSDIGRVRFALGYISADDRDTWLRIGMAIKSEYGEAGFTLWDDWGAAGQGHNPSSAKSTWKSIKPSVSGETVTIASLFYEAKQNGWKDDANFKGLTPEEVAERQRTRAERDAVLASEQAAAEAAAAVNAAAIWNAAKPCDTHPYLERKGVKSHGLRYGKFEIHKPDCATGEVTTLTPLALLMPIMDRSGKISTLQAISSKLDGRKSLLKGGRKSGNYFVIGSRPQVVDGRPVLVLVEGYATGASVHEATGHQVLVCVDAGNLLPVATEVRADNRNATILLAADNDMGTKGNPGLTKARSAAAAVGGLVAFPPWPERVQNSTDKKEAAVDMSDFNDWHGQYGLAAVAEVISKALVVATNASVDPATTRMPQSEDERELGIIVLGVQGGHCACWRKDTCTVELVNPADLGKKPILYTLADAEKWEFWAGGNFECSAAANFLINRAKQIGRVLLERVPPEDCPPQVVRFRFCRAQVLVSRNPASSVVAELISLEPQCEGLIRWDEFSDHAICSRDTKWGARKGPWTDGHDAALGDHLHESCSLNVSTGTVRAAVNLLARKNGFHPVADYLKGLSWDGVARLDTWLIDSAGASDTDFVRAVSAKTLIGAVARVLQPGCKFDTVLCLEGAQGAGKSSLLRALMPEPAWFADDLGGAIGNKDALLGLRGKWMLELAEFAAVKKSSIEEVKSFVARLTDHYREPYGTRAADHPRQCFFVGTINPAADGTWLSDTTGGRRFWPVRVQRCDITSLKAIREQIWAEAVHRYKNGEQWHLPAEIEKLAFLEQADRLEANIWDDYLERYLTEHSNKSEVALIDVFFHTNKCPPKSSRDLAPIAKAMRDRGWIEHRAGSKPRKRVWRPSDDEPPI